MSGEIYFGEMDVRRIEELTRRLEDLDQSIEKLTQVFVKSQMYVDTNKPLIDLYIKDVDYVIDEVRNEYDILDDWLALKKILNKFIG